MIKRFELKRLLAIFMVLGIITLLALYVIHRLYPSKVLREPVIHTF
jgi:hypothetical protein